MSRAISSSGYVCAALSPNGSSTRVGPVDELGSGASIVVLTRSPARSFSASAASSPATPPPAISTVNGDGVELARFMFIGRKVKRH